LFEKILQVPSHTVDGEKAEIVNVQISLFVGISNFGGVYAVEPVFRGDFRRYEVVQSLKGIAHIAVFFYFPIQVVDIVFHQIATGARGDFPDLGMLFPVEDLGLGRVVKGRIE
jgi:hypothetical protein